MAIPGYMWITDDQGQTVEGPVKVKEREGTCEILALDHKVYMPADKDTGALTGTRKHDDFVVTKAFDSTSPVLYEACCRGKKLQKIDVVWYRIDENGAEKEYFRHTLNGVQVVAVNPAVHYVKDPSREQDGHLENVHLRYEQIEWTHKDGNISSVDNWTQRS